MSKSKEAQVLLRRQRKIIKEGIEAAEAEIIHEPEELEDGEHDGQMVVLVNFVGDVGVTVLLQDGAAASAKLYLTEGTEDIDADEELSEAATAEAVAKWEEWLDERQAEAS